MSQKANKLRPGNRVTATKAIQTEAALVPEGPSPKPSGRRWDVIGICGALATLVFIVFARTVGFDFVNYDDNLTVFENYMVSKGISWGGVGWALNNRMVGHWDPMTTISHMADCQLYGLWAGGHHLTNVLLHAAAAVLLFLLLMEMTDAMWRSAFVAAAWAIHPLRVESVAWVTERKDVLSGLFFMLTLLAYLTYARRPKSKLRYSVVMVLFALGLMSKSMLMTAPCVLLLLDYWPLQRWKPGEGAAGAWRLVVEKIPLLLIAILSGVAAIWADKFEIAPMAKAPLAQRAGDALTIYLVYLKQMVWPVDLAVMYMRPVGGLPVVELLLAATVVGAISAGVIWRWKEYPWLVTGWLWYLGMLVPVAGFFQSDKYPQDDRYTYLPQIGLWIAGTWAVAEWSAHWPRRRMLLGSMAAFVLAALVIVAYRQTTYWRNSETLWTHTLACTRDNYVAYNNLGTAEAKLGKTEEAIKQYEAALRIKPDYDFAHVNLGRALESEGRVEEAIAQYRETMRLAPDFAQGFFHLGKIFVGQGRMSEGISEYREALRIDPAYADAHNNLGAALLQEGRVEEALPEFQKALENDPGNSEAWNNLGLALSQAGHGEEAIGAYREAVRIDPKFEQGYYNLGNALLGVRQLEAAIAGYEEALRIDPADAKTRGNLGFALLQEGKTEEAVAELRKSVAMDPKNSPNYYNLGKALLQEHDSAGAIAQFRKALELGRGNRLVENTLAWELATAPEMELRDGAEAVKLATDAGGPGGGNDPVVLRTLAAAYAQAGEFPNAVQTAQKALQQAEARSNAGLADSLRKEIELYTAGHAIGAAH